jgi:hypothetical protein
MIENPVYFWEVNYIKDCSFPPKSWHQMLTLPDATVMIFDAVSILIKLASPVCVRTGTKQKANDYQEHH